MSKYKQQKVKKRKESINSALDQHNNNSNKNYKKAKKNYNSFVLQVASLDVGDTNETQKRENNSNIIVSNRWGNLACVDCCC